MELFFCFKAKQTKTKFQLYGYIQQAVSKFGKNFFYHMFDPQEKKCLTPTQSALLGGNGWFERNAKEALQQIIFIGWDDWDWDVALTISGS